MKSYVFSLARIGRIPKDSLSGGISEFTLWLELAGGISKTG